MQITEDLKQNLVEFSTNVWHGYIHQKTGEVFLLVDSYAFVAGIRAKTLLARIDAENKDQPIVIELPPRPGVPKGEQNLLTEEAMRRFMPLDNNRLASYCLEKGIRQTIQEVAKMPNYPG
jgi:hypothetical protein